MKHWSVRFNVLPFSSHNFWRGRAGCTCPGNGQSTTGFYQKRLYLLSLSRNSNSSNRIRKKYPFLYFQIELTELKYFKASIIHYEQNKLLNGQKILLGRIITSESRRFSDVEALDIEDTQRSILVVLYFTVPSPNNVTSNYVTSWRTGPMKNYISFIKPQLHKLRRKN